MDFQDIFRLALVGGLVGLDTTAAFQVMICQPLVGGLLVGWAVGDPWTGAFVGLLFQGLFLAEFPVGGRTFPDGNLAAVQAAALGAWLHSHFQADLGLSILIGFLWALPSALLGGKVIVWTRRLHALYLPAVDRLVSQDREATLNILYLSVVFENFLISALFTATMFVLGSQIFSGFARLFLGVAFFQHWGSALQSGLLGGGCGVIFAVLVGSLKGRRRCLTLTAALLAAGLWVVGI